MTKEEYIEFKRELKKIFARNLKFLIDNGPDTQDQLSGIIFSKPASITNYINENSYWPNIPKLVLLARHYKVSLDFLITDKEPEHPDVMIIKDILEKFNRGGDELTKQLDELGLNQEQIKGLIQTMKEAKEKPKKWELFKELLKSEPDEEKVFDLVMTIKGVREKMINWLLKATERKNQNQKK